MDSFPPPQQPPTSPPTGPLVEPAEPAGPNRRMMGGVAAVAALVAVGGLVVGSQLVSADRPTIETTSAAQAPDDTTDDAADDAADDTGTDDTGTDTGDDDAAGDTGTDGADPGDEADDAAGHDDVLPAEFEAFEQCLDEQLGGIFGELGEFGDGDWHGSVVVENLAGDGEELFSLYDFGEGDATVTVTKSGSTISVDTAGDVTTFSESDLDVKESEFEAAEQACSDLLPADLKVFDMDFGDMDFGNMDFGEFDFHEMGEFDFDELGGMLEEFPFEDFIDAETLAELEQMFENGEFDLSKLLDKVAAGETATD